MLKSYLQTNFSQKRSPPPQFEKDTEVEFPQHDICQIYLKELNSKLKDQMTDDQWKKITERFPYPFDIAYFNAMQEVVQTNRDHSTRVFWTKLSIHLRFDGAPPNTLEEIRAYMVDPSNQEQLTGIHVLKLVSHELKVIPPEIKHLQGLQHFNLSHNQIKTISQEIAYLTDLRRLDLSCNQIRTLPPQIRFLTKLIALTLISNKIKKIPPEIGHLTALRELELSDNEIQSIPPEIIHLIQLEILSVMINRIDTLPPEIGYLSTLRELDLSANRLNSIPHELGLLHRLEQLDLRENLSLSYDQIPISLRSITLFFTVCERVIYKVKTNKGKVVSLALATLATLTVVLVRHFEAP